MVCCFLTYRCTRQACDTNSRVGTAVSRVGTDVSSPLRLASVLCKALLKPRQKCSITSRTGKRPRSGATHAILPGEASAAYHGCTCGAGNGTTGHQLHRAHISLRTRTDTWWQACRSARLRSAPERYRAAKHDNSIAAKLANPAPCVLGLCCMTDACTAAWAGIELAEDDLPGSDGDAATAGSVPTEDSLSTRRDKLNNPAKAYPVKCYTY